MFTLTYYYKLLKLLFHCSLVTLIMFILCLLVYPSPKVFAKDSLPIKVDEVMALNPSKQSPHTEGFIAWTYGRIYQLDTNLNVNNIVEYDGLTISNIIQVHNSLFIHGNSYIKGGKGEIEDSVIEYDFSKRVEKSRWPDSNYYKWSSASDDKTIFVMLSSGYQKKTRYQNSDGVALSFLAFHLKRATLSLTALSNGGMQIKSATRISGS